MVPNKRGGGRPVDVCLAQIISYLFREFYPYYIYNSPCEMVLELVTLNVCLEYVIRIAVVFRQRFTSSKLSLNMLPSQFD